MRRASVSHWNGEAYSKYDISMFDSQGVDLIIDLNVW